jgi:hypothetical protein
VARVVEGGEFIAMEAVALANQHVNDDCGEGDVEEDRDVAEPWGMVCGIVLDWNGVARHGEDLLGEMEWAECEAKDSSNGGRGGVTWP